MHTYYYKFSNFLEKKFHFDANYLLKGSFWILSGHVFTILAILVTSYFFANFLDPNTYGIYKYLTTAAVILSAFSLTGLNTAVIQAAAKKIIGYFPYAEILSLKYGLAMSVLSLVGGAYYALNNNWQLAGGLFIIAFLQPLMNSTSLIFSQFNGEQRFQTGTAAHIIRVIITTISTVMAILLSGNLIIILLSYLLSNVFSNIIVKKIYYRKESSLEIKVSSEVARITNYAKHVSLQNILSTITNQIDKILVFQNLGAADLAIYAFATAIPDQYKGITKSIETLVLPRFSQHSAKNVRGRMLHKTIIYFLCLLLLCLLYILAAPHIFNFLYPTYTESIYLSQIYTIGMLFGIGSLPISGMQAQLAKKRLYILNIATSIFQIVLLLILLPIYGLMGAVISRVLYRGFVALSAFTIYFYQKNDESVIVTKQ